MSTSLFADPFALKGEAVVITGGTSGIGLAPRHLLHALRELEQDHVVAGRWLIRGLVGYFSGNVCRETKGTKRYQQQRNTN